MTTSGDAFEIDLTKTFEHLPNAPIVEAVISRWNGIIRAVAR